MIKKGSWHLHSDSDSRWNAHGRAMVGGFMMSDECKQKLEKLKKKYGEAPEDLTWGYWKD